jgi:hypothetical protein
MGSHNCVSSFMNGGRLDGACHFVTAQRLDIARYSIQPT